MSIHHPARWLVTVGLVALLAACGGGGDSPASTGGTPASSGSQSASGTITGFGSVIVDGVRYDDSAAVVKVEDDAASPRSVSVSELKLGMQVQVRADEAGRASAVTVSSEVLGRISVLSATGFQVAGQTVAVSTDPANPTVFEGVAGLAGLRVADLVEVHGTRDANDVIVATRIERKDPASAIAIRVAGTVTGLDTTRRTFTVGGLTVTYDAATRILPRVASLADGERVAVWSNVAIDPATNALAARSIVVKRFDAASTDRARVGGFVRRLDFAKRTFVVDGVTVDASGASFAKGTASDLANGRKLRVRGTFTAGTLVAAEVRYVRDQGDAAVELTGVVTGFAGKTFVVRGVPVDVSTGSIEYVDGTVANLADGVLVRIEGSVDGSVVRPTRVAFVTSDDGRARWLFGEVAAYVPATGTFRVMGLDAKLAQTAVFRNADGTTARLADFGDADRVQVRGAFLSGVFVVEEVVFRPGIQVVVDGVEGAAYDVDASAGTFRLNGTLVRIGTTTVFEGSREHLRDGVRVEVRGTVVAGELVASRIEVSTPSGADLARVTGMVSDFRSTADFRVAGQKVDASSAVLEPAGAAVSNGRFVEVRGAVSEGVLKATRVTVR